MQLVCMAVMSVVFQFAVGFETDRGEGTAVVRNGWLKVAELLARAELPVEVKVAAYQFESGIEPRVQTADPVARTLMIRSGE